MLSKTDFLLYLESPMHLWAAKHGKIEKQPSKYDLHLMEQGREIEKLARYFLQEYYLSGPDLEVVIERTFIDGNFQSRADVVVFDLKEGMIDIYEIKSATSVRKEDKYDLAFQRGVCEATMRVRDVFLVHVNPDYVHPGELDVEYFFLVKDLGQEIEEIRDEVSAAREEAWRIANQDSPAGIAACLKPKDCSCPSLCHPDLPAYAYPIYNLPRLVQKKAHYLKSEGILSIPDIPADYPLSENQELHRQAVSLGKPLINIPAIREELEKLDYPLYFLDYETYNPGVPFFGGYHPYEQIVFQYSLHILPEARGNLEHAELLLTEPGDPGLKLVQELIQQVPEPGSVLVWYRPFEGTRNHELAERYPEYQEALLGINERIYDLMEVFSKGLYVHPDFRGSASIKTVLPVLVPEFMGEYEKLAISGGEEASLAWYKIMIGKTHEEEVPQVRENLLAYCKLDTLAMVRIYEHLVDMINL